MHKIMRFSAYLFTQYRASVKMVIRISRAVQTATMPPITRPDDPGYLQEYKSVNRIQIAYF